MLLTSNRCSIGERRNTSRAKSLLSRAVMGSVKDMSLRVLSKLRKIVCQTGASFSSEAASLVIASTKKLPI